jgi:hypothetical protein
MRRTIHGMLAIGALLVANRGSADEARAKVSGVGNPQSKVFTFAKDDVGKLPAGWRVARTGKGEGSEWKVLADATAPSKSGRVLTQTAASPRPMFNLCVADGTRARDVEISVDFKSLQGKVDQGGGVVWRFQDADNYYVARLNLLEENYRLYKVIDGKRIQLASAEEIGVKEGAWHRLTIRHAGKSIACFLEGKKVLEAEDNTIAEAGLCGLWTKADAVTSFDLFDVRDLGKGNE